MKFSSPLSLGEKGAMIFSKQVAFSLAALSGIAISTLLRKRLRRVEADCDAEIKEAEEDFISQLPDDAEIKEAEEDFISQLPDDILFKILVRLSTRDSVRTSILSKRWRNLYAFVPHMEFLCLKTFPSEPLDHLSYRGSRGLQERFINGLDTFLRLHSVSSINTCSLSCCFITYFPKKLEEWFCSLGRLDINKLILNFVCSANNHEMITFRCGLISLVPSLVYLKVIGCFLRPSLKIQPNCLDTLDLHKATLTPAAMACILSNCLNLKCLLMENCTTLYSTLRICGSNLQLKYLFLKFCSNVEEIEVWADNLILFEYFGCKLIEFSFEHVPKLETFSLTIPHRLNDENLPPFSCVELAKALPPVSSYILQIYGQYYEMFTLAGFNVFRNIRRLLLGFSMFKSDQLSVVSVLEMCPILYEFHLQTEKSSSEKSSSDLKGQEVARSFKFHNELKKVIFSGFSGTASEMDAAMYIVRSALVLQKMIISYSFSYYLGEGVWARNGKARLGEERREAIEKLLGGHAISNNAKVIVRPIHVPDIKL